MAVRRKVIMSWEERPVAKKTARGGRRAQDATTAASWRRSMMAWEWGSGEAPGTQTGRMIV
jgi:hypothetical protein